MRFGMFAGLATTLLLGMNALAQDEPDNPIEITPPGGGNLTEDIDGDCIVGASDLLIVLQGWGACSGCSADIDGDGLVGVSDMLAVLAAWSSVGDGGELPVLNPPLPVITALSLEGPRPYTVHVHALNSTLGAGSPLTARYEWDFGDEDYTYNELIGFNAAHVYRTPGEYTITLRLTNEDGLFAEASVNVVITGNDRTVIHVSPSGDDANDGATPQTAVRTVGRVKELLGPNTEVRFEKGHTYNLSSSIVIGDQNVVITVYGDNNNRPRLYWTGPTTTFEGMIEMLQSAEDVVVQGLEFDAPGAPDRFKVRAVIPNGRNITVRSCRFGAVSDAVNAERQPEGLLVQDNSAFVLGAYLLWSRGSDHVVIGNAVDGSVGEHNVRISQTDRILIAYNDLQNDFKSCVWSMHGTYSYIARNSFRDGPVGVGPNEEEGDPNAFWRWSVVESNYMVDETFRAGSGAEHVVFRNNVVELNDLPAFVVVGTNEQFGRMSDDIRILNNTGINTSTRGRFLEVSSQAGSVVVANNMYVAPNLETGSHKVANVYVTGDSLNGYEFRGNLWSIPATIGWGDGLHYVWPYWSHTSGYKSIDEWMAFSEVAGDDHRSFVLSDLDALFAPTFIGAGIAFPEPGVFIDFHGNTRAQCGTIHAGAVEPD